MNRLLFYLLLPDMQQLILVLKTTNSEKVKKLFY